MSIAPRLLTRRAALGAALSLPISAALDSALAQAAPAASGVVGDQAEWPQHYEGAGRFALQRQTTPILSPATVTATEQAIATYQGIVGSGGFVPVPGGAELKVGMHSKAVPALRQRLIQSGDLDSVAAGGSAYDSFVEAAVQRFQVRHGISATGVVDEATLAALNVPADARLAQLQTNLVRLRSYSGELGRRFVIVNIPSAEVETVEDGVVQTHHEAGVGKIDRQSPIMQTRAIEINFNPFWTVPPSLIKKDLIPKMQADPNYLTDEKIHVFDKSGREVPPSAINWNTEQAVNYRYRQEPGADLNSLGFVRINIANPYGVYMHDTPSKGVFGDDFRFVSSGCVRVQDVRDYVAWLLKDNPGWTRDQIDQTINSGARTDVKIEKPVNVYWVYITAWATPDGVVQFRPDIYKKDGGGAGPVASAVPAEPMALPQD